MEEVVGTLPKYAIDSFSEHSPGQWHGEFVVSCPVAPELAEGDLLDELAPHFPTFLRLKEACAATFELHIVVGEPGPEFFELPAHMVALLAALGANVICSSNSLPQQG